MMSSISAGSVFKPLVTKCKNKSSLPKKVHYLLSVRKKGPYSSVELFHKDGSVIHRCSDHHHVNESVLFCSQFCSQFSNVCSATILLLLFVTAHVQSVIIQTLDTRLTENSWYQLNSAKTLREPVRPTYSPSLGKDK